MQQFYTSILSVITAGAVVCGDALDSGDGSTQISPNHSFDLQVVELAVGVGAVDDLGSADVGVVGSLHPPNQPR